MLTIINEAILHKVGMAGCIAPLGCLLFPGHPLLLGGPMRKRTSGADKSLGRQFKTGRCIFLVADLSKGVVGAGEDQGVGILTLGDLSSQGMMTLILAA